MNTSNLEIDRPRSEGRPHSSVEPYGSLWELRRIRSNPLGFLQRLAGAGDVVDFSFRNQRAFLVNDPQVIEQVLVTEERRFMKPPALRRATRLLGQGLLTASEPLHTARRRVAQPAFHRDRYDGYGDAMIRRACRVRDEWESGRQIDINLDMSALALSIVGETLFGADLTPYGATLRQVVARAIDSFDPLIALVAPMKRLRPQRQQLDAIVEELIERRLGQGGDGRTLLDLLIAAGPASTPEQLHDDVLTILLAGFDTISNALTFTWMFLAEHPAADEALGRELKGILRGGRPPAPSDLPALSYVKAVFAESLRLRPPAWVIARLAREPLPLETGEIPAGALVLMSPYLMHRDPRYFAEPLAFRPERWLDASGLERPRFSYFPFGAGRRSCIGESFALMEGGLLLATLAQQWRLRFADGASAIDARITLRPRGSVFMIPKARA